jgi:pimeloyl-ACP methyl ester carboxylesterase
LNEMPVFGGNPLPRLPRALPVLALALALLALSGGSVRAGVVQAPASAASGDFARLVDIGGGRQLYLECRGSGNPTVILEAGYRASARYWTDDLLHPEAPRLMVQPGVARFTHVCAYDRPGTYASVGDDDIVTGSDPVPQPRTAADIVGDLHALLHAAGVPGPYVMAGHSFGGLLVRLYASTYRDEVAGLVLVDPYSELIEGQLTPGQWQSLVQLNARMGANTIQTIPGYGDLETDGFGMDNGVMRQAAAASPLSPMPLAVLAKGVPFDLTENALGFSPDALETALLAVESKLSMLVPSGRLFVAGDSGHDIHQDQPALVTEAIREVVEGVRNPDTWYDLTACCSR